MSARLHPGVYVEEVPSGARSIEGVGTSTAIFVGTTERGPLEPTLIKGIADYERNFGGYESVHDDLVEPEKCAVRYAIDAFFQNGGTSAYVLRETNADSTRAWRRTGALDISASSKGSWGKQLSVFVCGETGSKRFRLIVFYRKPGEAEHRAVEDWGRLSCEPNDELYVVDVLQRSQYIRCELSSDLVVAFDRDGDVDVRDLEKNQNEMPRTALDDEGGSDGDARQALKDVLPRLDAVRDAALLVVPAPLSSSDDLTARNQAALDYAAVRQDLFCIADAPYYSPDDVTAAVDSMRDLVTAGITRTNFGALYFPWVEITDPNPHATGRDPKLEVPPSGFIAGIYARTDQRRGVWKAPAGVDAALLSTRRIPLKVLDSHHDELNPEGVNVLRTIPGAGAVVWGARTLEPKGEWRYIPVRRTAIFLRRSIYEGIQWAVFEPNDARLWSSLRLTITAFMEQQYRQGAFAGATSRDSYFVKCDADTTPEADQMAGIVNVLVGFAPLRPAEFVVIRLSQVVSQKG